MKYTGNLNPGDELVIDMKAGTVKLNGASVLDKVTGSFFKLAPGSNSIKYADESTARALSVQVTKNSKYF